MKKYTKNNFKFLPIVEGVIRSGAIALKYFIPNQQIEFSIKDDNSSLSKADVEISKFLQQEIKKHYQESSIICEENSLESNIEAISQDYVFIIDPIDGTSSFVRGSKEFTVNVALVEKGELVLGIIYSPCDDILYYAEDSCLFKISKAATANYLIEIITNNFCDDKKLSKLRVITTSRQDELQEIKNFVAQKGCDAEFINISSSVKFCYLVENKADIYLRAARIKLWDVAAGFAIARAGGFEIVDYNNQNLLEKIFDKKYINVLQEEKFRVDYFIVRKLGLVF